MILSITVLYMQCRYAEYCYVECRDLFTIMLNVIMLNVVAPHWAQVNTVFLSRSHETGLKSVMSSNIFPEKNEAAGLFCTRSPLQIQPTVRTLNSSPSLHSAKTHIPRSISNSHSTLARLFILIYSKRVFILGYLCCRVIGLKKFTYLNVDYLRQRSGRTLNS